MMLAGFVLPSYAITPIAAVGGIVNYSTMFLLARIFCALQGIIGLFLPELGAKALKKGIRTLLKNGIILRK